MISLGATLTGIVKNIRRAISKFGNALALSLSDKYLSHLNILNGLSKTEGKTDFKTPAIQASFIFDASNL